MQKPSTLRACSSSIASMIKAESVAFLPLVKRNCWQGRMESVCNSFFHGASCVVVQSPYARHAVALPKFATIAMS
jgi:hypothetical protein